MTILLGRTKTNDLSRLFRLDGRTAVVTGVLGKLGVVWTEALLAAGASVVGIDREEAPVPQTFESLRRRHDGHVELVRADIRRRGDLNQAAAACRARFREAGIVVNNAGIDQPPALLKTSHRFEDIPLEAVRETLEVNFLGAFQVLQAFGDDLAASGHGSVINIGSLYAEVSPDPRLYEHIPSDPPFLKPPAYGASKAALVNLTKYLATLWAPRGVRVNALSPGGVLGSQDEEFKKKYCARVPLGRMALFEDLTGPLLFLASDASSYVTGINLMVDGGLTVW